MMLTPKILDDHLLLKDLLKDTDGDRVDASKINKQGEYTIVPTNMSDAMFSEMQTELKDLSEKKFLILDTIEYVLMALHFGVKPCNIVFRASDNFQVEIAKEAYGIIDAEKCNLTNWKKNKNMNLNEFIVVGNLPFTDGSHAEVDLYTPITNNILDQGTPLIMSLITPENLINGPSERRKLRERLQKIYKFSYINFLNQTRDWGMKIKIATVSWTVSKSHTGPTIVKGRHSGKTYSTVQLQEYVNGETQQIHDWLLGIQTPDKIRLLSTKAIPGKPQGQVLKISKNSVDCVGSTPGEIRDCHIAEWRVAFGYLRGNACAIVPPGVSLAGMHKYKRFGNDEATARKWASYMMSTHVRFIMHLTYTSRSLDNPQLRYVPNIDVSTMQGVTDTDLDAYWKYPKFTDVLKPLIGDKVPF